MWLCAHGFFMRIHYLFCPSNLDFDYGPAIFVSDAIEPVHQVEHEWPLMFNMGFSL